MYKSKSEIEKKLKQIMAIYKKLLCYEGKVFVRDGYDEVTETYPFLTEIGSFLSHSRSIFQYSFKEAKLRGKILDYNTFLSKTPIIGLFKDLRDTEIHESTLGKHTLIHLESHIEMNKDRSTSKEENKGTNEEKQSKVSISLSKKLNISPKILHKFQKEGKKEFLDSITKGEDLYEEVTLNGESDVFNLLEIYITAINKFIEYGTKKGFIT